MIDLKKEYGFEPKAIVSVKEQVEGFGELSEDEGIEKAFKTVEEAFEFANYMRGHGFFVMIYLMKDKDNG